MDGALRRILEHLLRNIGKNPRQFSIHPNCVVNNLVSALPCCRAISSGRRHVPFLKGRLKEVECPRSASPPPRRAKDCGSTHGACVDTCVGGSPVASEPIFTSSWRTGPSRARRPRAPWSGKLPDTTEQSPQATPFGTTRRITNAAGDRLRLAQAWASHERRRPWCWSVCCVGVVLIRPTLAAQCTLMPITQTSIDLSPIRLSQLQAPRQAFSCDARAHFNN